MDDGASMTLYYAFPDGSPSFVHGFEAGRIGARMQAGETEIDCGFEAGFPIHNDNVEVLRRMAAAEGYIVDFRPTDWPEWTAARFHRPAPGQGRPKLRIV